jgi:hypothetical protein
MVKLSLLAIISHIVTPPIHPIWYDSHPGVSPNISNYIEKRLIPTTNYFHEKASSYLALCFSYQVLIILAGALIPILSVAIVDNQISRISSSFLAGIVVMFTAYIQLVKLPQTGLVFRNTEYRLQKEYHTFIQKTDGYLNVKDPDKLFIDNVESLILDTTSDFYSLYRVASQNTKEINTSETNYQK